jgi:hypothetical protein
MATVYQYREHSCPFLTSQWVGTSAALEPFVLTTLRIGEEG